MSQSPKTTLEKATAEQVQSLQAAQDNYVAMLQALGKTQELAALQQKALPAVVTAKADATLKFFILKGHLTAQLTFPDGKLVNFDAWPWGIGEGIMEGIGVYYGVDAATLIGSCHYHCQWGAIGGGFLQFTCWRDNFGALGQVNVVTGGEGVGETGGDDGNFTWG